MSHADPIDVIQQSRLLVIVRLAVVEDFVAEELHGAGVRAAEISMRSGDAPAAIARWRERFSELYVGAGTVVTRNDAEAALAAGAAFLISPGFHPPVARAAAEADVPYIPGAFTPTEIHACAEAGARLIKLFPAALLGPQYVRDVLAPFPGLRLIPAGGVDADNAGPFLTAGAAAVAVGSALVSAPMSRAELRSKTRAVVDVISISSEGGA